MAVGRFVQMMASLRSERTRLRLRLVCVVSGLASALLIFGWISHWNEPGLAGKKLSVWQKEQSFRTLSGELDRAGTNAIPFLIEAAKASPPIYERVYVRVWGFWFRKVPVTIRQLLPLPGSATNRREMVRRIAIARLAAFSPDSSAAMIALRKLLRAGDQFAVLAVVEALGRVGGRAQGAVASLLELLDRSSHDVAVLVVRALGNIAPRRPEVVEALTLRLDHSPDVALAAARILRSQQLEQDRVVTALAGLLNKEASSAWDAANLLGQYGVAAGSALPALIELLRTPDKRLRRKAAITLGKLGPAATAAESALRDVLQDEETSVREAATVALTKIAGQR